MSRGGFAQAAWSLCRFVARFGFLLLFHAGMHNVTLPERKRERTGTALHFFSLRTLKKRKQLMLLVRHLPSQTTSLSRSSLPASLLIAYPVFLGSLILILLPTRYHAVRYASNEAVSLGNMYPVIHQSTVCSPRGCIDEKEMK